MKSYWPPSRRELAWACVGVVALAFAVFERLWLLASRPGYEWDEPVYASVARNVSERGLLQTKIEYAADPETYLYHPPFYFWQLGGWFEVFGVGITQARAMAALMSIVMLFLVFLLMRRSVGWYWALLAVVLVAFDGWVVLTNRVSWMENSMMLLGIAGLWLYSRAMSDPRLYKFVMAGAMLGATAIYKHIAIYFLVACAFHWLLVRRQHGLHAAMFATSAAVVGLYVGLVGLVVWSNDYWRQSSVQVRRALGDHEARGTVSQTSDVIGPLLDQYWIFGLTLVLVLSGAALVVIRSVQMVRSRSIWPIRDRTLLFAWAATTIVFFGILQLKMPHYFIMAIVPMYCFLVAEAKRYSDFRWRTWGFSTTRLVGWTAAVIVLVNIAVFTHRIALQSDNALKETATWMSENAPRTGVVITEETIGTIIPQRYCKMYRAPYCEDVAEYLIVYTSHTQYPPDEVTLNRMQQTAPVVAVFTGFREKITIYKLTPKGQRESPTRAKKPRERRGGGDG